MLCLFVCIACNHAKLSYSCNHANLSYTCNHTKLSCNHACLLNKLVAMNTHCKACNNCIYLIPALMHAYYTKC